MSRSRPLTLALLLAGLLGAPSGAGAAAACKADRVTAAANRASVGANRTVQFGGELRDVPRACKDTHWVARAEARVDGEWTAIGRLRLTRRMVTHRFVTAVVIPGTEEQVRLRWRVTRGADVEIRSRSVLIDLSTFADLPSP